MNTYSRFERPNLTPRNFMPRSRLPARERQVADIVYERGEVAANDICDVLKGLSNSAVRSMLSRLEIKGVVRRRRDGRKFTYLPAVMEEFPREQALQRVANDMFGGSLKDTLIKVLDMIDAREPGSADAVLEARAWAQNNGFHSDQVAIEPIRARVPDFGGMAR